MQTDRSMQIKVGALILVATGVLVGFVFLLGSFSVGEKRRLYVCFNDSGSMLRGAPVKIAGVRAGRVEAVRFLGPGEQPEITLRPGDATAQINIEVTLEIAEHMAHAVRENSEFYITTQGVLGEKYLEIVPGDERFEQWPAGARIRGKDPARIDLLFARADSILRKVEEALSGERGQGMDLGRLVRSFTRLTEHLDALLTEQRDRLGRIFTNVDQTAAEAAQLVGTLREGLGSAEAVGAIVADTRHLMGILARRIEPVMRQIDGLVEGATGLVADAGEAVGTARGLLEESRPHLARALADLPPITAALRGILRDAAAISAGLTRGRGTIGQLIVDQEIYDDLKEMLRDLKRHPWKMLWRE